MWCKYKIDIDELREMYIERKLPKRKIAEYYGCSLANIGRILKKNNIKLNSKKGRWTSWNKGLTKDNNDILKRIANNRIGEDNPMYKATPWNKGLTKETDDRMLIISEKRTGIKVSNETKRKLLLSIKRRWKEDSENCGMSGRKHTKESKEKMRLGTIKNYNSGIFDDRVYSGIHRKVFEFIKSFNKNYDNEIPYGPYVFDIGYKKGRKFIEIHGDYWHFNTDNKKIRETKINKTQFKNFKRDIIKSKYIEQMNTKLLVIWEYDIINNWEEIKVKVRRFINDN